MAPRQCGPCTERGSCADFTVMSLWLQSIGLAGVGLSLMYMLQEKLVRLIRRGCLPRACGIALQ